MVQNSWYTLPVSFHKDVGRSLSSSFQSWLKASADILSTLVPTLISTQIVEAVGSHARFLLQLYPLFVNSLSDGEDEVCNNAVFGLGVLAANALPDIEK